MCSRGQVGVLLVQFRQRRLVLGARQRSAVECGAKLVLQFIEFTRTLGEWVDLDIDRADQQGQAGMAWNSGFVVAARVDEAARVWYGEMRIPFAAIDPRGAEAGRTLRVGLYRIAGADPRTYYAWQPTGARNFHVPEAFGTLRLQ